MLLIVIQNHHMSVCNFFLDITSECVPFQHCFIEFQLLHGLVQDWLICYSNHIIVCIHVCF